MFGVWNKLLDRNSGPKKSELLKTDKLNEIVQMESNLGVDSDIESVRAEIDLEIDELTVEEVVEIDETSANNILVHNSTNNDDIIVEEPKKN